MILSIGFLTIFQHYFFPPNIPVVTKLFTFHFVFVYPESQIPDLNITIPDPGSKRFRIPDPDPHQRILVFFNPKIFLSSRILIFLPIPVPGPRVKKTPDPGSQILDPRSRIPDPRSQIPDPGTKIPDPRSRIPRSWIPDPVSATPALILFKKQQNVIFFGIAFFLRRRSMYKISQYFHILV
jgi:hypothetical protein